MDELARYDNSGGMTPDFDAVYEENGILRGELAALYEEMEHIERVTIPTTQTVYLIKVGALRVELLRAKTEIMKSRRRVALLKEALEKGTDMNGLDISRQIDEEFWETDSNTRYETYQINAAKLRFSSLAQSEDAEEIRSVYRIISRKMNPDINTDISPDAISFWPSARAAYLQNDLFELKALLLMANDYPESYDLPSDMGSVYRKRDELKGKIASASKKLENVRQHPIFGWKAMLENEEALAAEQAKLRSEIEAAHMQRVALQDMASSLEMEYVRK